MEDRIHTHAHTHTQICIHMMVTLSQMGGCSVAVDCAANADTDADESLCKIIDSCCHGDAPVGRPQMPRAKRRREGEGEGEGVRVIIREQSG